MDEKNLYKWRAILPLSNLVFPVDFTPGLGLLHHFELVYYTGHHYDGIISSETRKVPLNPPITDINTVSYMQID